MEELDGNGEQSLTGHINSQAGKGLIKVNGKPLSLVEPGLLRFKVYEPVLIVGTDKFGTLLNPLAESSRTTRVYGVCAGSMLISSN